MPPQFRRYFEYSECEGEAEPQKNIVVASEGGRVRDRGQVPEHERRCVLCMDALCVYFECERCSVCFLSGHPDGHCVAQQSGDPVRRCSLCKSAGHVDKHKCPDALFTMSMNNFVQPVQCCLCGKAGHWTCAPFPGPRPLHCASCGAKGHGLKACAVKRLY